MKNYIKSSHNAYGKFIPEISAVEKKSEAEYLNAVVCPIFPGCIPILLTLGNPFRSHTGLDTELMRSK